MGFVEIPVSYTHLDVYKRQLGNHDEDPADRHHRVGNDRKVIGEGDDLAGFAQASVDPPGADQNDAHQTEIHKQVHQRIDRGHPGVGLEFLIRQSRVDVFRCV